MKKLLTLIILGIISLYPTNQTNAGFLDWFSNAVEKTNQGAGYVIDKGIEGVDTIKNAPSNYVKEKAEEEVKEELEILRAERDTLVKELESKTEELKNEIYIVSKELSSWKNIGKMAFKYLVLFLLIISAINIFLFVSRIIIKYILYKFVSKSQKVIFQKENQNEIIGVKIAKSIDIRIDKPHYVKNNSILKYEDAKLFFGVPFMIKFWYLFKRLYFWNKVKTGKITLTSPNHYSFITEVNVAAKSTFVFNLANLLAFEVGTKIYNKFHFNPSRIIEKKIRSHYVKGPTKIYLYGVGEIVKESISKETVFEKNTIIAYSGNLDRGLQIVNDFPTLLMNKKFIKESYSGKGIVLRQKIGVTDSELRKMNKQNSGGIIGVLQDIVGFF